MAEKKDIKPETSKDMTTDNIPLPENRLEGRDSFEGRLATWFEQSEWHLRLVQLKGKGYGMIASDDIEKGSVVMSCPPYVFVPYETRKTNVCAYCFNMFAPDPEGIDKTQDMTSPPSTQEVAKETSKSSTDKKMEDIESKKDNIGEHNKAVTASVTSEESSEARPCQFCEEVWYCCDQCQNSDLEEHCNYECQALQKLDVKWVKDYYQYCDDLITDIRLLIRAINKRQISLDTQNDAKDLDDFTEQYGHLISNKECYSQDVLSSLRGVIQLANYLLPDDVQMDEDELLDLYCKHRVNMFGVWGDSGECLGYGVYPRASFFNHSCWPNVTFYKNKTSKSPFLDFVSVYSIPRGTEVCISYIDISEGLKPRRFTLKDKYFFHCECDRCSFQEKNPNSMDPYNDPQYYTDDR
eukprot:TRINITY_DN1020_c0_g2_i3.p1 TRINITY_DN1020_c0_g2~~TRINITY_DN1020_c0_g2_i3.p1  ORF type:complete len:409 (-),score=57.91 TRINITY_DN1020_c0_g2_i3:87-1313(-)